MGYASFALVDAFLWLLALGSVVMTCVQIVVAIMPNSGGRETDPRLKEIADGLSNHQIDSHGGILQSAAITALVNKPESPEAEFLFRAVRANLLNAATDNNVSRTEILPKSATSLTRLVLEDLE